MSILLALDTVTDLCRCALYQGDKRLAYQCEALGKGHGEHLINQMEKLIVDSGIDKSAINRIAVTTGPGSFTGMRIGVAVARSLKLALGIGAVGVSRFECIDYAQRQHSSKRNMPCAVILPAVQNKFSVQIFAANGQALCAAHQATTQEIIAPLTSPIILAGDSAQTIAAILENSSREDFEIIDISAEAEFDALAALGAASLSPAPPSPLYMRSAV